MERDGNWTIAFFNPGKNPGRPDVFGCATLGAVDAQGAHSPDADGLYIWRRDVPGRVVCGSCAQCLAALNDISFSPACIIALLAQGNGAEAFLEALRVKFPGTQIAGGVSASAPGGARCSARPSHPRAQAPCPQGGVVPRRARSPLCTPPIPERKRSYPQGGIMPERARSPLCASPLHAGR